jgi:hypothetical protein
MRRQCVRACIAGGYKDEYVKIMDMRSEDGNPVAVDRVLVHDAETCPEHRFFEPDMIQRMIEQGNSDVDSLPRRYDTVEEVIPWREADLSHSGEIYSGALDDSCLTVGCDGQLPPHMYDDLYATMGLVRFYLSSPVEIRARAAQEWAEMGYGSESTENSPMQDV